MNQFSVVVVNVNGERKVLKFGLIVEMVSVAERLLDSDDIAYILVDFVKITNSYELKIFESGIRFFKNYLFNVR